MRSVTGYSSQDFLSARTAIAVDVTGSLGLGREKERQLASCDWPDRRERQKKGLRVGSGRRLDDGDAWTSGLYDLG